MLPPAAGQSSALMGGRGAASPPWADSDEVMCGWMDAGRAVTPSPLALLSDSAHIAPGERAPCVSTDAFEDSLHGTWRDRSCPDPPSSTGERCQSCTGGTGACGVTWPGSQQGPARADSLSQAHPLPVSCQTPNGIIRPTGCPALPKHKPFPSLTRINSPSLEVYKQHQYFFHGSTVPAGRARATRRVLPAHSPMASCSPSLMQEQSTRRGPALLCHHLSSIRKDQVWSSASCLFHCTLCVCPCSTNHSG